MSGSFDPVSGRPTGSAPPVPTRKARAGKGGALPTGTVRRDRRNSARGRGRLLTVVGLLVGLGLIGAALLPQRDNGSPARAAAESTTTTTSPAPTTTTTTTATTTTTTTESALTQGWQAIPVHTTVGGPGQVEYDVPSSWSPADAYVIAAPEEYSDYALLQSAAKDSGADCSYQPSGAGIYLDWAAAPSAAQADEYAKGLADITFGTSGKEPVNSVAVSKTVRDPGWSGHEVVVHSTLTSPLGCGLHEGTVALIAMATDQDPDRTIMIAAFGGTDSGDGTDEATLRKIVQSVRVTP